MIDLETLALHLAGEVVEIRHRAPCYVGTNGVAHRHEGKAIIDVDPALSSADWWWVFLHELAHVRCGHLKTAGIYHFPPRSIRLPPPTVRMRYDASYQPHENEADRLARAWLAVEQRGGLTALLLWKPQPARNIDRIVENAVKSALQKLGGQK